MYKRTEWIRGLVTYEIDREADLDEAVSKLWNKYGNADGRFRVTHITAVRGEYHGIRVVADYVATGANGYDLKRRCAGTTGFVPYSVAVEVLDRVNLELSPLLDRPSETEIRARDQAHPDELPHEARKRRGVKQRRNRSEWEREWDDDGA